MNFLKNLKIKNKLRIPIILQLIILLVIAGFYVYLQFFIGGESGKKNTISNGAVKIRQFSTVINAYLDGKQPHAEVVKEYQSVMDFFNSKKEMFADWKALDRLKELGKMLDRTEALIQENQGLEKQVIDLTGTSIKQSNGYLSAISIRLADRKQRSSVSDLERRVIAGAAVNTTSNYEIRVKFLQFKGSGDSKDLVKTLDTAIANSKRDEQRLAGTPFAELPKKATEANTKLKTLTATYIGNWNNVRDNKLNIRKSVDQFLEDTGKKENESADTLIKIVTTGFLTIVIVAGLIILLSVILNIGIARLIGRPIVALTDRAYDLAVDDVDMTRRLDVDSKDDIGELSGWFNKFLERLQDIIRKVRNSSVEVNRSTDEIAGRTEKLATRVNEQAASITETSTTLEQFTASIRQNTENSAEADMMLVSFNQEIQEKSSLIDNVTNTMTEIFDSSKEIDNIIKVINDISFQTNLLALNAAVEAARAGEAGRGFAVVAAEVRNLAQKTAESSKTIQDIVLKNVESTQKGMDLVKDTSEFFGEIVGVMGEIVTKISDITSVSREQAGGIEQINVTINQMDQVSRENAAVVEELSEFGRNVRSLSIELQDLVSQFKLEANETPTPPKSNMSTPTPPSPANTPPAPPAAKKQPRKPVKQPAGTEPRKNGTPTEEDFFGPINDEEGFEEF